MKPHEASKELIVGESYRFSVKPSVKGDYNYWGYGWSSVAPCFAAFDGENWVDGPVESTSDFWIYTDKPEPFGHYNPEIKREPEPKNDLVSRLERYKASKKAS